MSVFSLRVCVAMAQARAAAHMRHLRAITDVIIVAKSNHDEAAPAQEEPGAADGGLGASLMHLKKGWTNNVSAAS